MWEHSGNPWMATVKETWSHNTGTPRVVPIEFLLQLHACTRLHEFFKYNRHEITFLCWKQHSDRHQIYKSYEGIHCDVTVHVHICQWHRYSILSCVCKTEKKKSRLCLSDTLWICCCGLFLCSHHQRGKWSVLSWFSHPSVSSWLLWRLST